MNRRDFLKFSGMGALALLTGSYETVEAEPERKTAVTGGRKHLPDGRKVDFHCHAILPSYIKGMERLGIDPVAEEGYPLPQWTPEAHREFMKNAEIDYSVLSMPSPHIYNGNAVLSQEISREINEEMAAICRSYPDSFGFAATIPLPDTIGSLEEICYAMDELGALGVKVASNSNGVYLGDPCLDDIFKELDRRRALVILHPGPAKELPRENVVTGNIMALFEYPADTTRAVLNLLAHGTLERYPGIRLVIPHTGAFLPYMKQRAKSMFALLGKLGKMEPVDVDKSLDRIYFDLAGDPLPEALGMLLNITDDNHIVYGSDYPYVLTPILLEKKKQLDEVLITRHWAEQFYVKNAAELLK